MIDALRVNYEQSGLLWINPGIGREARIKPDGAMDFTRLRRRTYLLFGNAREALSEED
jgi:hypothetical protein